MEFVDVGKHCAVQHCRQQDFLPFTCDACQLVFCREHRTYDEHHCTNKPVGNTVFTCPMCSRGVSIRPGEDPNLTFERHLQEGQCQTQTKPKCPVPKCKTRMTDVNSLVCGWCQGRFCTAHRFEDAHNCPSKPRPQVNSHAIQCKRCPMRFVNSRDMIIHYRTAHAGF